jgi:hypothetical protein
VAVIACGQAPGDTLSRLPKSIGGEALAYHFTEGPEFRDDSGWELRVLKATKMPASAMTAGTGFTSPAVGYTSFVLRIRGTRGADLVPLMAHEFFAAFSDPPVFSKIEGKTVASYRCSLEGDPTECGFFYAFDDVAIAMAGRPQFIAEALRQLP